MLGALPPASLSMCEEADGSLRGEKSETERPTIRGRGRTAGEEVDESAMLMVDDVCGVYVGEC